MPPSILRYRRNNVCVIGGILPCTLSPGVDQINILHIAYVYRVKSCLFLRHTNTLCWYCMLLLMCSSELVLYSQARWRCLSTFTVRWRCLHSSLLRWLCVFFTIIQRSHSMCSPLCTLFCVAIILWWELLLWRQWW